MNLLLIIIIYELTINK